MIILLFVYNAKSGKLNALLDVVHKLFSPETYQCSLCALTFDAFSENNQWKQFREQSDITMEFYHIDEFEKAFPNTRYEYPVILKVDKNKSEIFIDKEKLNTTNSVDDLIVEIKKQVQHDRYSLNQLE